MFNYCKILIYHNLWKVYFKTTDSFKLYIYNMNSKDQHPEDGTSLDGSYNVADDDDGNMSVLEFQMQVRIAITLNRHS